MKSNSFVIEKINSIGKEGIRLLDENKILTILIQKLITSHVIEQTTIEDDHIDNIKKKIVKEQGLNSQEEFTEWLKKSNLTEETFFNDIIRNIKLTRYCTEKFGHMTESLFLKKQDELDYATYSIIRVRDFYLSNELFLRIKEGEASFGDIATEFSIGPEKATKGVVGPAPISKGHPIIKELIRSSEIGIIQEPVRINNQIVIFRLEALNKACLDENTKIALSKEIFSKWLKEETNEVILCLKVK